MRVGYLWRGYLADVKLDSDGDEISTPDGNATYSWSIVWECMRRKYSVIPLGDNLDAPAVERLGRDAFKSFSQARRANVYEHLLINGWVRLSDREFPELDLLLIEWRWPILGRNTADDKGKRGYQNDLERQNEVLLEYMKRGTTIVVWDLDHKLTYAEEDMWGLMNVIETAVNPKIRSERARQGDAYQLPPRVRVEPPFCISELLQHDIDERMPHYHLGYIGSRYERDETIDEWIKPIATPHGHRAKFWGKWEPAAEVRERWPGITFAGRIGVQGFREAYSRVAAVPLLAKRSYYEAGFVTPRVWESILFGSIPIGLSCHNGIDRYCDVASSPNDLLERALYMKTISPVRRRVIREEAAHRLQFMDASNFVDTLESIANGTTEKDTGLEKGRDDG